MYAFQGVFICRFEENDLRTQGIALGYILISYFRLPKPRKIEQNYISKQPQKPQNISHAFIHCKILNQKQSKQPNNHLTHTPL